MEHETTKLKCQEEEYQREVRDWKDNLKPRKQVWYLLFFSVLLQFVTTSDLI